MYYVYRYVHPDFPYLYVGKTKNLVNRIYEHDYSKNDNIDRKYETLLQESSVYYIEFNNSTQMSAVELFLIDKYKPYLNKKDKFDGESAIDINLPRWKKYIRKFELEQAADILNKACQKRIREINSIENDLKTTEKKKCEMLKMIQDNLDDISVLEKSEDDINELTEYVKIIPDLSDKVGYSFDPDEIDLLFENYPQCNSCIILNIFKSTGEKMTVKTDKIGVREYINEKLISTERNGYVSTRDEILFRMYQSMRVSEISKFHSNSIIPLILLRQIYRHKLSSYAQDFQKLIELSKGYTYENIPCDGGKYYHSVDEKYGIYYINGKWEELWFGSNMETIIYNLDYSESIIKKIKKYGYCSIMDEKQKNYIDNIDKINEIMSNDTLWISDRYSDDRKKDLERKIKECKYKIDVYSKYIYKGWNDEMKKQDLVRIEMIEAMREKDKEKKDTLALLLAALKNAEIDKMRVLSPEEEDAVVQKEIKQTKETLEMTPADRTDIIQQCNNRLAVLQQFAPQMMNEAEIEKVISDVLKDLELDSPTKKEKGKIMKVLMPQVKGKADGKLVNTILERKLR